jgi:general secretion pathway protein I
MKARSRPAGFTLLEVLVALAVMAIAVTLLIGLFSANLRAVARSGSMTEAAARADSRISAIAADPSLAEAAWSENGDDGYRMDVVVREMIKERTENLPVRMMEVDLTIRWMEGGRERAFKLKTARVVDKAAPAKKA